jgi:hypothetical protein
MRTLCSSLRQWKLNRGRWAEKNTTSSDALYVVLKRVTTHFKFLAAEYTHTGVKEKHLKYLTSEKISLSLFPFLSGLKNLTTSESRWVRVHLYIFVMSNTEQGQKSEVHQKAYFTSQNSTVEKNKSEQLTITSHSYSPSSLSSFCNKITPAFTVLMSKEHEANIWCSRITLRRVHSWTSKSVHACK